MLAAFIKASGIVFGFLFMEYIGKQGLLSEKKTRKSVPCGQALNENMCKPLTR